MSGVSANLFPGAVRLCICTKKNAQSCIPMCIREYHTLCVYVAIRRPTEETWFKVVLIKGVAKENEGQNKLFT